MSAKQCPATPSAFTLTLFVAYPRSLHHLTAHYQISSIFRTPTSLSSRVLPRRLLVLKDSRQLTAFSKGKRQEPRF